jgi:Flp pilus assembly protein TadB
MIPVRLKESAMTRKRRYRRPDPRLSRMMPEQPGWRWRTLPVWLALTGGFVVGWYVDLIGSGVDPGLGAYVMLYVAIGGFSLGLSRIVRWMTERYVARRRLQKQLAETPPAAQRRERRHRTGDDGASSATPPQT